MRLREWQSAALAQFEASSSPNFLAVATPGAGKTAFALTAARRALLARQIRRVVIVVPTQHLKLQWAHAAERFGLHLDPDWAAGWGVLPSDVHGIVVTYQQVAANPGALRPLVRGALAILDEIHHAGESRSWGDGVRHAFEHAARRLSLSGTPFRSDQNTIPFVNYEGDLAQPDYDYGYGQALEDQGVVRPVYFPRINGQMEWTAPDGSTYSATFDDRLTRDLANQRLRTALDHEGDWLPAVLAQAHAQLQHLRGRDPSAAGLVIAMDQEHAHAIADIMATRFGLSPVVATSDDPSASQKISQFSEGRAPWMVAVRMVSEGVDIPRLRVGVYATHTITELFFRQAVGRMVRWQAKLGRQAAYVFIPDDLRLRTFALAIAEQRRHSLRKNDKEWPDQEDKGPREVEPKGAEQLSLFAALSAVPLDQHGELLDHTQAIGDEEGDLIPDLVGTLPPVPLPRPETEISVPLPEPEPAAPRNAAKSALTRRRELREQNSVLVRELAHATGKSHAELNGELNRKSGIRRISEATVRQLEQRLAVLKGLLRIK